MKEGTTSKVFNINNDHEPSWFGLTNPEETVSIAFIEEEEGYEDQSTKSKSMFKYKAEM
jgi:hypothetical protein